MGQGGAHQRGEQRWCSGGGPVGWHGHEAKEIGEGGDGVLRRARNGGREEKKRGREASTAVRRRDVAGSGPAVVLVVGALMGAA
jgi:hypothetical protein